MFGNKAFRYILILSYFIFLFDIGTALCQGTNVEVRGSSNLVVDYPVTYTQLHLFPRGPAGDYHMEGPEDAYGQKKPFKGECGKFYMAGVDVLGDPNFVGSDGKPSPDGLKKIEDILLNQCTQCLSTMRSGSIAIAGQDFQSKLKSINNMYTCRGSSQLLGPIFRASTAKTPPSNEGDMLLCEVVQPSSLNKPLRDGRPWQSKSPYPIVATLTVNSKKLYDMAAKASVDPQVFLQDVVMDYSVSTVGAEESQSRMNCSKNGGPGHY